MQQKTNQNSKIAVHRPQENVDNKTQELMDYFKINRLLLTITTVQDHIRRNISNLSIFSF